MAHGTIAVLAAEAIGTFLLTVVVGCGAANGSPFTGLAAGLALVALVFTLGPVSGAALNPAVSVALLASKRGGSFCGARFGLHVSGQLVGALAAAFLFHHLQHHGPEHGAWSLHPVAPYTTTTAMVLETLYSTLLSYVVLATATCRATTGNHHFGLAIGFVVLGASVALGRISQCALNPAVALAAMTVDAGAGAALRSAFAFAPLYLLSPLAGSLCASLLFRASHASEFSRAALPAAAGKAAAAAPPSVDADSRYVMAPQESMAVSPALENTELVVAARPVEGDDAVGMDVQVHLLKMDAQGNAVGNNVFLGGDEDVHNGIKFMHTGLGASGQGVRLQLSALDKRINHLFMVAGTFTDSTHDLKDLTQLVTTLSARSAPRQSLARCTATELTGNAVVTCALRRASGGWMFETLHKKLNVAKKGAMIDDCLPTLKRLVRQRVEVGEV